MKVRLDGAAVNFASSILLDLVLLKAIDGSARHEFAGFVDGCARHLEIAMPPLTPRVHGAFDLLMGTAFLAAPTLFGITDLPEALCYMFAAIQLLLTASTAFPLGVVRSISLPTHGALEFLIAVLLVALPWLIGFDLQESARNVFVLLGVLLFAVWLATDYQAETGPRHGADHRPAQQVGGHATGPRTQ